MPEISRRLELEAADAVLRGERARGGERQAAGQVAQRIGPAALLLLAHGVEVDDGAARDAAVAGAVELGSTMPTGTWLPARNLR